MKIREQTIRYAKAKKTKIFQEEVELEKSINILQEKLDGNFHSEIDKTTVITELERKKQKLEKIIEYKTKGAILRSQCRWYNEGEKNTKYFLNLEKRHFKNNVISQLKLNNEEFITSDKEILSECENFYKNLYSSNIDAENKELDKLFFEDTKIMSLDSEEKEHCEGLLTKTECLQALKTMPSGKTPGSDGLPIEFYETFWDDISDYYLNSINYGYSNGQFSVSQRRGVIKLIPKKDAIPYYVRNWRPITLLNCDYKIAAKAIANRLKTVIPGLINDDQ